MKQPKIVVVNKQTTYSKMIDENVKFEDNSIITRWKASHDRHYSTLENVTRAANKYGTVFNIEIPNAEFIAELSDVALVITVGGDGTLLGASHNVNSGIPVLGVNSDPETSVGFFCTSTVDNVEEYIDQVIDNKYTNTILTRMLVKKNGVIVADRVLNDVLYCHTNPATTSSYILEKKCSELFILKETQKSSGFWIGPAAGSTGARRSAGFDPMPIDAKVLQLCVRELYHRPDQSPGLKLIDIGDECSVHVRSKMSSAAMYIDGDHKVVPVGLGDEVSFRKSNNSLLLVGKPSYVFCK
jgi:NAD+ kinase